jgi:DNA-binding IscR family transcriptional regulator
MTMPDTASSAHLDTHPDAVAPFTAPEHAPEPPCRLPPQARILFDRLAHAAERGEPCPSNFALMDALDLASPDGIRKHMGQLRAAGLVRVESAGQRRRVEIVATGHRTDWSSSGGNARAGAMFSDGWGNGSDALLLRMAAQGLDLTTMATRLGRTTSSVRHRLRRLRAAGRVESPAAEVQPESAPSPPAAPTAPPDPGPMRREVVTNDRDRPAAETAQIEAFLARGGGRKVPPAYVGEVRGATPLAGIAPISPRARRALRKLDEQQPRPARAVALSARLDPLLMPEVLHELKTAGLAVRHAGTSGGRNRADAGYARTPAGTALARALGLLEQEAPS